MKIFCERLKELIEEKGLSANQLAKELNTHHSSILRWESGERVPSIDNLYMLAVYFNVSADYLLGLED